MDLHKIRYTILGLFFLMHGCAATATPLATLPSSSPAASRHNLEGINHYNMSQWREAQKHFEAAIQADPRQAEYHYNLALTLHQLGKHNEATVHFRNAGELAPNDLEIVESSLYRNHLGLSSTFERHMGGGYRY